MKRRFHTLDVFTEQRFGGNPLAVVLDADGIATAQMQQVAREFNLSETVFVQKPTHAAAQARVRIFTPSKELPFAGHPTLGTACLLAELGRAPLGGFVLEETIGPVAVTVRREAGRPLFAQLTTAKLPELGPPAPAAAELAAMLGLSADAIETATEKPRLVSCGLPYVLLPLREAQALGRIEFDLSRWKKLLSTNWADHVLVYHRPPNADAPIRARMFAPGSGVMEDPATGSAAVALAGALASESPQADGTLRWSITQGVEMGRPSQLYAEADKKSSQVTAVRVGGHAVPVSSGELEL